MATLTVHEPLASQLEHADSICDIRNAQGEFLGVFAPGAPEEARLYLHAWLSLDPAEVQRQKSTFEPTYSYADMEAHLTSD